MRITLFCTHINDAEDTKRNIYVIGLLICILSSCFADLPLVFESLSDTVETFLFQFFVVKLTMQTFC